MRQEDFDLVQGRGAAGSGRAVLIEQSHIGTKSLLHTLFDHDPPHLRSLR